MMDSKIIAKGILIALAFLLLFSLSLFFLYQIHTILVYLVISLVLTLIGLPIQNFLKDKLKFSTTFASITVLSFFVILIISFIMMFIPLIVSQGQNLSLLKSDEIEKNILELFKQINVFLIQHHIDSTLLFNIDNLKSFFNIGMIPAFLNSTIEMISNFGIGLGSVLFITFFFLKDKTMFIKASMLLIPDNKETRIINSMNKIYLLLSKYFIGLIIQLFIVFILYLIVLSIFGVSNPFIIAFLCAVLNIIPYIGPLIASVLAAILSMISNLGFDFQTVTLPTTLYVLIGFWIVQLIDNNFSQPIIFSKSVSSHPLEIFLVILIAGLTFGILGMIIAVPLYTIIKVICKEFFPNNQFIQFVTKNI